MTSRESALNTVSEKHLTEVSHLRASFVDKATMHS